MTLQEIYNLAVFHIYGETIPPPAMAAMLQAVPEGIICNTHKKLQTDNDFWFMEERYNFSIISGTQNYALPADFKREISMKLLHSSGYYTQLLEKRGRIDIDELYTNPAEVTNYPAEYEIWESELWLYPIPSYSTTLNMRYYRYLPDVTAFNTHTDALTAIAPDLIAYLAVVEVEMSLDNQTPKLTNFFNKAQEEIRRLKDLHWQKSAASYRDLPYQGV